MTDHAFNLNELLEKVLSAGKEYVEKGQTMAEAKLNIPEGGAEREVMLNGLKKGAIASMLLVGLLGTSGGRKITGTAIKLGGLAALGSAAFTAYKNWRASGDVFTPVHELDEAAAEDRGLLLIEAMVSAAHADGHIDDTELTKIKQELLAMHLPGELAIALENIMAAPLTAEELAQKVSDPVAASEVYLAARLLIDNKSSQQEQSYLKSLVNALGLHDELVAALEAQVTR